MQRKISGKFLINFVLKSKRRYEVCLIQTLFPPLFSHQLVNQHSHLQFFELEISRGGKKGFQRLESMVQAANHGSAVIKLRCRGCKKINGVPTNLYCLCFKIYGLYIRYVPCRYSRVVFFSQRNRFLLLLLEIAVLSKYLL